MLVSVLGPAQVQRDGEAMPLGGARVRTLVAALAADGGRSVPADVLADRIWPDEQPGDVANALQSLVSRLRRACGEPGIVVQAEGAYRLVAEIDTVRFEQGLSDARSKLRAGRTHDAREALDESLSLWRGPALPELADPAPGRRLDELRLVALEERIQLDIEVGRAGEVISECDALSITHPLRERFSVLLMRALLAVDRRAEALAAFERTRRFLAEELGSDPGPELRQAHMDSLVEPAPRPEPVEDRNTNLRTALTTFVGREDEVKRVAQLLDTGRLVTIIGPGGAGKTRTATVAAGEWIDRNRDGVWMVELAPVTDEAAIVSAVLGSLGVRANKMLERPQNLNGSDPSDRLLDVLADSDALLVIDNCEHLIGAVALLLDRVLTRCPGVRVLATSREPLGIDGESLCLLPPLRIPADGLVVDKARTYPAVTLFADRAALADPDFEVDATTIDSVVEIVRRLDGLPLAIELAAARLRVLPIEQIALRLSDRFRLLTGGNRAALPRHRTLRAVVEWSWDLLTPQEALLAERLAVFPSGATPDSARAICADDRLPAEDIDLLLDALVDKSLLQRRSGLRYRMLETIREYGAERLSERSEMAAVREAHAAYFAALVCEVGQKLTGHDQLTWLRLLEDERDNAMAALRYLCDSGDAVRSLSMTRALGWYWTLLGGHSEASTWGALALAVPDPDGRTDPTMRAVVSAMQTINALVNAFGSAPEEEVRAGLQRLTEVGDGLAHADPEVDPFVLLLRPILYFFGGPDERIYPMMEEAARSDDPWVRATALMFRASINENGGQLEAMRLDAEAALDQFGRLGDRWGMASSLSSLAELHTLDGELQRAIEEYQRAAGYMADFGATSDESIFHLRLSSLYLRTGDLDAARQEASRMRDSDFRGARSQRVLAESVEATIAIECGDVDEMRARYTHLKSEIAELESVHPMNGHIRALALTRLGALCIRLGDLDAVEPILVDAYVTANGTRDMPVIASTGVGVAQWADAVGRPESAAEILGASDSLRGAPDPTDLTVRKLSESLTATLGPEYERLVAQGRALDHESALRRLDPAQLLG